MKRVGILARDLTQGGVTRYILNLLKEFESFPDDFQFFLFQQGEINPESFPHINHININSPHKLFFDWVQSPRIIQKYNLDAVIYPKNIIPPSHFPLKTKKINIIHDLGYFRKDLNAYQTLDTLYMKSLMKLSCKYSTHTLTVSNNTKNDLIQKLKIDKNKITPTYEGIESSFKEITNTKYLDSKRKEFDINSPFLFFSGGITPRKNLLRTLQAFYSIKEQIPHNFYITGTLTWKSDEVYNFIEKYLNDRVKLVGKVSEENLIALYNLADIYVFPSLLEGFGLPILEAQACGTPVITSNISSCPEVGGNGVITVDPYNKQEIADKILTLANSPNQKESLQREGFKNIERFSWKEVATTVLEKV